MAGKKWSLSVREEYVSTNATGQFMYPEKYDTNQTTIDQIDKLLAMQTDVQTQRDLEHHQALLALQNNTQAEVSRPPVN